MANVTNRVVQILQKRDGMRQEDAIEYFESNMNDVYSAIETGDWEEAEEIFEDSFGLEIDYLIELI